MFRKILVLVRGNDPSQPALQRAVVLASRLTELRLLDIAHEPMLDGYMGNSAIYAPLRERVVAERDGYVKELVSKLRDRGLDVAGEAVWDHPLDEAVAKRVRGEGIDLVVAAPADATGRSLSNSEWRLVTNCPAPLLVVKSGASEPYRHIVAAVDPYRAHAKPAQLDLAILAQARELQAWTGAELRAVHCFTPYEYFGADFIKPMSRTCGSDARLEELEQLLRSSELPASHARLEIGAPHDVLRRLAESGEADLIVMGALARGRLKDWVIGSTAERVLHGGRVDVLAVKPVHTHQWTAGHN